VVRAALLSHRAERRLACDNEGEDGISMVWVVSWFCQIQVSKHMSSHQGLSLGPLIRKGVICVFTCHKDGSNHRHLEGREAGFVRLGVYVT
jgi:hypothetical protein